MTRISTGLVSVEPGGTIVTLWQGDGGVVLSEITAPVQSSVVIEGAANFIKQRLTTESFELVLPHAGAGGDDLPCAISALTARETQIGTLNGQVATTIQQLEVIDANGRGLFYNFLGVTGDNDPGPGNISFNAAQPEDVTEVYLDLLDANDGGRDVAGIIDLWAAGAVLVVRSIATNVYVSLQLLAAPAGVAGYRHVAVRYVSHSGELAAEPIAVEWRLSGADRDVDEEVDTQADLAPFADEQPPFRVLVRDYDGQGRAARISKLEASGAWSGPAYVTGPAITLDEVPYGVPPDVSLTPVAGGYGMAFELPRGMIVVPGTITTLAPDQPAAWDWEPIEGGYRVHLAVPRGPTGDINGVTPFWTHAAGVGWRCGGCERRAGYRLR